MTCVSYQCSYTEWRQPFMERNISKIRKAQTVVERKMLGVNVKDRILPRYLRSQTSVRDVLEHTSKQKS